MPRPAVAMIEMRTLTASMVALDTAQKASGVAVVQVEQNDLAGTCIKLAGDPGALEAAVEAAREVAAMFRVDCTASIIRNPDDEPWGLTIDGPRDYAGLLESYIVYTPAGSRGDAGRQDTQDMAETSRKTTSPPAAIGFIETQGYTAVIEAIDTACKSGNVQVIGREKLGGGYITVIIQGDVAAVEAAVEAGKAKVDGLGNLIASHVIARPSEDVLQLIPKP